MCIEKKLRKTLSQYNYYNCIHFNQIELLFIIHVFIKKVITLEMYVTIIKYDYRNNIEQNYLCYKF